MINDKIQNSDYSKPNRKHLANVSQLTHSTKERNETPVVEVDEKKSKKRSRKDRECESKAEANLQPPKKRRKNRTEFADPREDSSLTSQSRKALEYVFMQMNKPSKWKFNKARQNWLIRNLWSPEGLPEIYFPLTLNYLSKTQGGSRMKLIKEARTILDSNDTTPDPEKSPGKTVKFSEPGIETTSKIKPIPGPLISMDSPTPGPLVDSEPMSTSIVAESTKTEIKKRRAQKLVEVLDDTLAAD